MQSYPVQIASEGPAHISLPGLLAEIAAVVGVSAALKVAATKGGIRAYFPSVPEHDHWLSDAVGHETALKICAAIAPSRSGVELLVPLGPQASGIKRWRRISEMVDDNVPVAVIARTLGMHERSVQYHKAGRLKRVRAALSQPDMFD
jgi:ActR/RegA family two-component response regulator